MPSPACPSAASPTRYSRKLIIGIGLLILGMCGCGGAVASHRGDHVPHHAPVGGVGGAGNGPATLSMLGDLFPPAKLPKALAVMNFGFCAALGLPLILGAQIFGVPGDARSFRCR